ncbi:MAG: hypothetical protein J7L71_03285 [Spirochaetaceae bacterium]|nr:hypothetical protein [Spirochaetaceae bacterium]
MDFPGAKTIIVAGIYIGGITLPSWTNQMFGRTSRLYLSEFFLDIVKPMEPIADLLKYEGHRAIISNSETNEGSVLPLKLAAIRVGLGWQGKQSLLISKIYGSFLALGGIITNAELVYNTLEEQNSCGKCNKCQTACPLNALDQSHVLNINKCLSYHLQSEDLPQNAKVVMENRIGDCEICQDVCPWNKKHLDNPLETKLTLQFRSKIDKWEKFFYLPNLVKLTEKEYLNKLGFLGTGISYEIFHRNVLIAMGNNNN